MNLTQHGMAKPVNFGSANIGLCHQDRQGNAKQNQFPLIVASRFWHKPDSDQCDRQKGDGIAERDMIGFAPEPLARAIRASGLKARCFADQQLRKAELDQRHGDRGQRKMDGKNAISLCPHRARQDKHQCDADDNRCTTQS